MMTEIKTTLLNGLHEIIDQYDGFLIDVYGVVHEGTKVYPHVIECLEKISEHEKSVALISNSALRSRDLMNRLIKMGIVPAYYQHVFTAGEAAYRALLKREDPWYSRLGSCCYYIGPSHFSILDDLQIKKTEDIYHADFILVTGADDWHQKLSDYKDILQAALARDLPMICANPNVSEEISGARLEAGTIEQYYEENGGRVRIHGKPNAHYVTRAVEALGGERILMIGDSLHFDVLAAEAVGIDAAFVACGLHGGRLCDVETHMPDLFKIEPYYRQFGITPRYTLSQLMW